MPLYLVTKILMLKRKCQKKSHRKRRKNHPFIFVYTLANRSLGVV